MATTEESDEFERLTVSTASDEPEKTGRLRRLWDTLQRDTEDQHPETVAREVTSGNVEDVDPPEDIDEFVDLWKDNAAIRKNINEFVDDVVNPGVRIEVDEEQNDNPEIVHDYFMGGENAPDSAPSDRFLSECFVFDETRQPFGKGLEISVRDR